MHFRRAIQKSAFMLELRKDGRTVGSINVLKYKHYTKVDWVMAAPQRRGYGTKLYEEAARMACSQWNIPLGSGIARSEAADSFWVKQERKGRARCAQRSREKVCRRYVLTCPAPASLAGRKP